jgi:2-keto-4-pentenoate hydratase/2-oxohepta-3-ene-1,7-dioic acid hydratase in catechol pathway
MKLAVKNSSTGPLPIVQYGNHTWSIADIAPDLLSDGAAGGLLPLLKSWDNAVDRLWSFVRDLSNIDECQADSSGDLLPPILYPSKVICTGTNYRDHVRELQMDLRPKSESRPAFFLKPPTTTIVGSGYTVPYPEGVTKLDWEIELAVAIGKTAKRLSPAKALGIVAGYTVAVDLSARDKQSHPQNMIPIDLFGGKAFDASCPLGPALIPARFVSDPQSLELELQVNGKTMQKGSTGDMIWSVAEQIALISEVTTLMPGDVILTGTPAGVGLATGTFLKRGDQVNAVISEIGALDFSIA